MQIAHVLLFLIGAAAMASAYPKPTVYHTVRPGSDTSMYPTCRPTVISTSTAFLCYSSRGVGNWTNPTVQLVNPSDPTVLPKAKMTSISYDVWFTESPIPVGESAAIGMMSLEQDSAWALITEAGVHIKDRRGSTAGVTYSPSLKTAFVPTRISSYPSNKEVVDDAIQAYSITTTSVSESPTWTAKFSPNNLSSYSIQTPKVYDGVLYMIQDDTLYALSAKDDPKLNNQVLWSVKNPCGIVPTEGYFIQMEVVTYGKDANGNLDAFILYANTTTTGNAGISVCRLSHHTRRSEWANGGHVTISGDMMMVVENMIGGKDVLFVSGRFTTNAIYDYSFTLLAYDIHTGERLYFIKRHVDDRDSFPSMLSSPTPGCNSTFAVQSNDKLTAYCTENKRMAWSTNFSCRGSPLVIRESTQSTEEFVVCFSMDDGLYMVNAMTGAKIWSLPLAPSVRGFAGTSDVQYVNQLVWAVDEHSTLYGVNPFKMATPAPSTPRPGPPGPPAANDGGPVNAIVAVVVTLVIAIPAIFVAGMWWKKRRDAARRSYQAPINTECGYGGV